MLALALAVVGAAEVSAHRRDEYLQAARMAIDPGRVQIELDLTPGIALADAILADIDRNRDGSLSADEQQAYAALVVERARRSKSTGRRFGRSWAPPVFPTPTPCGVVRAQSGFTRPRRSRACPTRLHQLLFRNRHHPESQCLSGERAGARERPRWPSPRSGATSSRPKLTIDYVLRAAPARPAAAWLLGGLAAATALSALLMRPVTIDQVKPMHDSQHSGMLPAV